MADDQPMESLPATGGGVPYDETFLLGTLEDLRHAYLTSMSGRFKSWDAIHRAYRLRPESTHGGEGPYHSKLVAETTRSFVNTLTAKVVDGLLGMAGKWSFVAVRDDQGGTPDEIQAFQAKARAAESMLDGYARIDMKADAWLSLAVNRATLYGDAAIRLTPRLRERRRWVKGAWKKEATFEEAAETIANKAMRIWPLTEPDWSKLTLAGHESRVSVSELRSLARKMKLDAAATQEIIASKTEKLSEGERKELTDARMSPASPGLPEGIVLEDWHIKTAPKDGTEDVELHVVWAPEARKILWVGPWKRNNGRHPYYRIPYGMPTLAWDDGLGHDLLTAQAGGSATWNIIVDNLRAAGFNFRGVRKGSMADTMGAAQAAPGQVVYYDEPDDLQVFSAGNQLTEPWNVLDRLEQMGMRSGGVTMLMMGKADTVLKSGADPSTVQMLLQQSASRLGMIDKGIRAHLTELQRGIFSDLQQWAPGDFWYSRVAEDTALQIERMRYEMPEGDLEKNFRIVVGAPSPTINEEVVKQQLVIVGQVVTEHLQLMQAMQQSTAWGQATAARMDRIVEELVALKHQIVIHQIRLLGIPGLFQSIPEFKPTPTDEVLQQAYDQLAQAQAEIQQLQQQVAQAQQPPMGVERGGMNAQLGLPQ